MLQIIVFELAAVILVVSNLAVDLGSRLAGICYCRDVCLLGPLPGTCNAKYHSWSVVTARFVLNWSLVKRFAKD